MSKNVSNNEKIEESIFEIIQTIFLKKNYDAIYTVNNIIFIIAILGALLSNFMYTKLHVSIVYIYDLLQTFINIYSIIIGFSFAAITLIATIFNSNSIQIIDSQPSKLYPNFSLYKATILVHFEYILAFIFTLIYMITCLFIYPFLNYLTYYKNLISVIFFVSFYILLAWSLLSIKALICNLYITIMVKSRLEKNNSKIEADNKLAKLEK